MATIYVIREDGATDSMPRVRCTDEDRQLQTLLERNHDLLPGDQIDPDDPRRWVLIKREMAVPDPNTGVDRWSIDFLFADQDAVPTFVECKRFADTRSRREIVGQLLEYAANGHHYWSDQGLRAHAEATANRRGLSIEDVVENLRPSDREGVDEFFARMQRNLREGRLRVIFFLEDSPFELRSVVDFLNGQMERSEVLLVEARQYSHSGLRIVAPTLFGYTEQARRLKRAATVTSGAGRKRWDRTSYFDDATEKVSPKDLVAMEELLDFGIALGCEVTWGTGLRFPSYNIKEPSACPRSLMSCWSHGDLTFNFGWLTGSEAALRAQRLLRELVTQQLEVQTPETAQAFSLSPEHWVPKLEKVKKILEKVVTEARGTATH